MGREHSSFMQGVKQFSAPHFATFCARGCAGFFYRRINKLVEVRRFSLPPRFLPHFGSLKCGG